jgi:hypothetical protein
MTLIEKLMTLRDGSDIRAKVVLVPKSEFDDLIQNYNNRYNDIKVVEAGKSIRIFEILVEWF